MHSALEKLDHGHHVLRVYGKAWWRASMKSSPPSLVWKYVSIASKILASTKDWRIWMLSVKSWSWLRIV